jgi:predicted P-loop ATPase
MIKSELVRLHGAGFAVHLLKPRSKRPVDSGWTSGARQGLKDLLGAYKKGQNLGVRLGKASRFQDGTYLAVIDCDVKGTDKKYEIEMAGKFKTLFPDIPASCPSVISGRGNGSCHFYIRTKSPATPKRRAQSKDIVKVLMPSVQPSKNELKSLTTKEIEQGIRLRPAWEISVMGEGQQVVLPPSIHPDSGRAYQWVTPFKTFKSLPLIKVDVVDSCTNKVDSVQETKTFKCVSVDLGRLKPETIELIKTGSGCEDRSAAMFSVAMQMKRAGFDRNEILSTLTERDFYLGECGYDHTKSDSRAVAAKWVARYTLDKAEAETDVRNDFKDLAAIEAVPELSDEEAAKQLETITCGDYWRNRLDRSKGGKVLPTMQNTILILRKECGDDIFRFDEFACTEIYGRVAPWGGRVGAELADHDYILLKDWVAKQHGVECPVNLIHECAVQIARRNRFHPVKEYLNALEWDGVPRVDSWLKTYLNAEGPGEYLQTIGRKTLAAMVARVMEPGCKFDYVLILEGAQGVGKSTVLRYLVGDDWFSDADINLKDRDSVLTIRSKWLIEMGELTSVARTDNETLKGFITRTCDRVRVPYGHRTENFPRQCVFVGTTNQDDYLKDASGNRRFWPVKVGECLFNDIRRDRDQLFAEAYLIYQLGEALYIADKTLNQIASDEQNARVYHDAWIDMIGNFLDAERKKPEDDRAFPVERFTANDLFADFGPLQSLRSERATQMRASDCLKRLGYVKRRASVGGDRLGYIWEHAGVAYPSKQAVGKSTQWKVGKVPVLSPNEVGSLPTSDGGAS